MNKKVTTIHKLLKFLLSLTIIFLIVFFLNISTEQQGSSNYVVQLENKIHTVSEEELRYVEYERDEWTSDSQLYECYKNHGCDEKYTSIRKYSFYESEWYNWDDNYYVDPYTEQVINDVRQTDYDHIIPLAYVNSHGGEQWNDEKKKEFADDPSNGVCVNIHDNREKGAKGPSEWLPDENKVDYCYTWLVISDHYGLSISDDDMNTIKSVLSAVENVSELSLINDYQ